MVPTRGLPPDRDSHALERDTFSGEQGSLHVVSSAQVVGAHVLD
jgi:hypothetical protein